MALWALGPKNTRKATFIRFLPQGIEYEHGDIE